jgi:Arc/MetJ family transcription regulator
MSGSPAEASGGRDFLTYTLFGHIMCIDERENAMIRTNIVLDDVLVAKCQRSTGIKTRRALINHALEELLRHDRQKKVLELKGTVRWEGDLAAWRKKRG